MSTLEKSLRNLFERTVKSARDAAEDGARIALCHLGTGEAKSPEHLFGEQKDLRRRLRIHGRQIGDERNPAEKTQAIDLLAEEIAYEHWHRMLFARFLAENDLLMYPDPDEPVAVSLEECEDLAADEGVKSGWELAARYAARMLPRIFRVDSPVFEIALPPEHQQKLEKLLGELPAAVFTASDSIGWAYQFWQSRRKDEVNASGVKIGARELPAVTQLFTEPYMVAFLLDNSLGAWWAARRLSEADLKGAESEAELREKAALPGLPLAYLRFVKDEDGVWGPAAGRFDGWPAELKDLKVMDPCCGSGHFLVAVLVMLAHMRMEMEGLSAAEAVDAVLRENLHGLEIDRRCVELAAFALALAAWRFPGAGGYRELPEMAVACSGLAVSGSRKEWENLANGNSRLRVALVGLHEQFRDAPVLGSLINPGRSGVAAIIEEMELADVLESALRKDRTEEEYEAGVVAHGIARAAKMLAGKYNLVITNVPYLTRGKQKEILKKFSEQHYSEAKYDIATVFLDRCTQFCVKGGTVSVVLPQNWLFLTSYKKFREKILLSSLWHLVARLGSAAFETIGGEVVKAILLILSINRLNHERAFSGFDISQYRSAEEKGSMLLHSEISQVNQNQQLKNPDFRVTLEEREDAQLLSEFAVCPRGIVSGDGEQWVLKFWEEEYIGIGWEFFQGTSDYTKHYSGCDKIIDWSMNGEGMLRPGRDNIALKKEGINVSLMSSLPVTLYKGAFYDQTTASIVPKDSDHLLPLYVFCSSEYFIKKIRSIDQKLNVTPATLLKVPFDLRTWIKFASAKYPNGLPKPYSNDPTQWIFHGHPSGSVIWDETKKWTSTAPLRTDATVLQIAVARLLGYRWPAELDPEMELADEQREWLKKSEDLLHFADEDGLVSIPPVLGEPSAPDRLLNILAAAYGDQWSTSTLSELLKNADHTGKNLESWLRDKFFIQHCKLFHHRPFIWHIWDGLPDGFSILANYHKLDYKNLETLIYTYLGDWIKRQKDDRQQGIDGAEEKLAAAEALRKRLEAILKGEDPNDIFVRWKPLHRQPIGWNPDINDGVRLNIRPFIKVGDVKKKGAGILRDKPNIKWNKDRGKDVTSAPWYHLGLQYGGKEGDRINDHHLKLEDKHKASEEKPQ